MLIVFAVAIFVSAALLFLVQPMVARMILPRLGGAPAVWNTCMVFFQALLLAGYAYAHVLTKVKRPPVQVAIHAAVCAGAILLLPVGLPEDAAPGGGESPIPWLLASLLVAVGAPFFVLSATGPLLQRWFSATDHRAARDPYFLYAASNAGSLLALLAYPFLIEPTMRLKSQSAAWSIGYALLALVLLTAGIMSVRRRAAQTGAAGDAATAAGPAAEPAVAITWWTKTLWVLLSLAPSSLMLGVTSYISTDLASVPLLWVMPLVVYLLTMIVAYSRFGPAATRFARLATPVAALAVVVTLLMQLKEPIALLIALHLFLLLASAMACHGRLAALRPPPRFLTGYFLLVSLGGVLGGAFNALVAPLVFNVVLEYAIAIALVCWLGMTRTDPATPGRGFRIEVLALDLVLPGLVLASLFGSFKVVKEMELPRPWETIATLSLPVIGCIALTLWPRRFAAAVGAMMVVAVMSFGGTGRVRLAERSFFGVHRVVDTPDGRARKLLHGTTNHGVQLLDPAAQQTPVVYYTRSGPVGQVFDSLNASLRLSDVGIIGLGTGGLAPYARPGQRFTFYEIDPTVERIARDPGFFTFLSACAGEVTTVLGDGRLSLKEDGAARYDLLVLDAFTSDAIPVHLLTVEAFGVYLSRLADRGVVLLHLSNRYLDLAPVVAGVSEHLGLVARLNEYKPTEEEARQHKAESVWALVARRDADLGALALDARWRPIAGERTVWTDDFSNIVDVLKGRR